MRRRTRDIIFYKTRAARFARGTFGGFMKKLKKMLLCGLLFAALFLPGLATARADAARAARPIFRVRPSPSSRF
jgi:hypothetical protein